MSLQRASVNKILKKSKTIDFKIIEDCVYLPTRDCVHTYVRLAFFEQDVEAMDTCCTGGATDVVGIVKSAEDTFVVLIYCLLAMAFSSSSASLNDKPPPQYSVVCHTKIIIKQKNMERS